MLGLRCCCDAPILTCLAQCHGVHGYQTDVSWCGALRQAGSQVASRGSACQQRCARVVCCGAACGLVHSAKPHTTRALLCCCCMRLHRAPGGGHRHDSATLCYPTRGGQGRASPQPVLGPEPVAWRPTVGSRLLSAVGSLGQGSWCGAAEMQAANNVCQQTVCLPCLLSCRCEGRGKGQQAVSCGRQLRAGHRGVGLAVAVAATQRCRLALPSQPASSSLSTDVNQAGVAGK